MKAKQPSGSEDLYHVRIRQPAVKISLKRSIIFKYPTVVGKQQTPQGPNELGLGKSQLIFPGEQKQKNMFLIILELNLNTNYFATISGDQPSSAPG